MSSVAQSVRCQNYDEVDQSISNIGEELFPWVGHFISIVLYFFNTGKRPDMNEKMLTGT